jgi:hypothetical protein
LLNLLAIYGRAASAGRLAIGFVPFTTIAQQLPDCSADIFVANQSIRELIGQAPSN